MSLQFVRLLIGLGLVQLSVDYPLLSQFQLDVVVESIAAEFVVVVVAVFVLALVDFAAVAADAADAAVAADLDSEQLV